MCVCGGGQMALPASSGLPELQSVQLCLQTNLPHFNRKLRGSKQGCQRRQREEELGRSSFMSTNTEAERQRQTFQGGEPSSFPLPRLHTPGLQPLGLSSEITGSAARPATARECRPPPQSAPGASRGDMLLSCPHVLTAHTSLFPSIWRRWLLIGLHRAPSEG